MTIPLRRLGNSGLTVSRLALGTMLFGASMDEAESQRLIGYAADRGLNFLDTADSYVDGRSEEIIGRAIAGNRNRWVLATKIGSQTSGEGPNCLGLSRKWIYEGVQASLRRLNTDFVDILYLHMEDHLTPLEETVRALGDLQRSGLTRYFGVSNFRAWRIAQICGICDEEGIPQPIVCSPGLHVLNRSAEIEIVPACEKLGLGVVPWGALARGILSGKYRPGAPPPAGSRAAVDPNEASGSNEGRAFAHIVRKRMMDSELLPENVATAAKFAEYAHDRGADPSSFAIAWALANPKITGVVAGARTTAQLDSYLGAFEVDWTPEDEDFLNTLVPPGTTAVPQFVDPLYPVEGRQMVKFGKPAGGPVHPGFGSLTQNKAEKP